MLENISVKLKTFSLILLTLIVISFLCSTINRYCGVDDAWLGEYSYQFSENGYVKSELLSDYYNYGERILVYHKLFIITGALAIKIFGFSLYALKSISFIFYIIFIYFLYLYYKNKEGDEYRLKFIFSNILLLSSPLIFLFIFMFRPEVMVMSLGFISYYFIARGFKSNKNIYIILSAVFAGLAALAHLNGLIFIAGGLVLLLYNKKLYSTLLFFAISMVTLSLYFFDLGDKYNFNYMFSEFTGTSIYQSEDNSLPGKLIKIINIHKILFHSVRSSVLSALFLLSVILYWKIVIAKHKQTMIYFLVLILTMAVISRGSISIYMILYVPYMVIIISEVIFHIINTRTTRDYKKYPLLATLFLLIVFGFMYSYSVIKHNYNLPEYNREVLKKIPHGSEIIGPNYLIFNEINNYKIKWIQFADLNKIKHGTFLIIDNESMQFYNKFVVNNNSYKLVNRIEDKYILSSTPHGIINGKHEVLIYKFE